MALLDQAPHFSTDDAQHFAEDLFGIQAKPKALPSERDQNFLLRTEDGVRFVLKIANANEERALLEAQNQAMTHLHKQGVNCPQVIHSLHND